MRIINIRVRPSPSLSCFIYFLVHFFILFKIFSYILCLKFSPFDINKNLCIYIKGFKKALIVIWYDGAKRAKNKQNIIAH